MKSDAAIIAINTCTIHIVTRVTSYGGLGRTIQRLNQLSFSTSEALSGVSIRYSGAFSGGSWLAGRPSIRWRYMDFDPIYVAPCGIFFIHGSTLRCRVRSPSPESSEDT